MPETSDEPHHERCPRAADPNACGCLCESADLADLAYWDEPDDLADREDGIY